LSIFTSLGDEIKEAERATCLVLPKRTYTILRLDGRSFHTYLRDSLKPFDFGFMSDMASVAEFLCYSVDGCVFAFTQSDEISLLLQDFESTATLAWFGGKVQKIVSTSAALASVKLNALRPFASVATFDSRVFTLGSRDQVVRYFEWRQRDCIRNSVNMLASYHVSHKRLQGMSTGQREDVLQSEFGVRISDFPLACQFGSLTKKLQVPSSISYTHKGTGEVKTVDVVRSVWETTPAFLLRKSNPEFVSMVPEIPEVSLV
jgi:tRNA(His) guanylyltransferase